MDNGIPFKSVNVKSGATDPLGNWAWILLSDNNAIIVIIKALFIDFIFIEVSTSY